jgi:hypothetical protein
VKKERVTQIVLVIVGLLNLVPIYFLIYGSAAFQLAFGAEERVRADVSELFIPVGVFLLIASRRPFEHRSMIALAAWWNISHGSVMAIQTVEAWIHGVHRNLTDVIVFSRGDDNGSVAALGQIGVKSPISLTDP